MKMMIGGAFQGKTVYAEKEYPNVAWKLGSEISFEELCKCEGVIGLHDFIRKEMKEGRDVSNLAEWMIQENPEILIVSDEVGYGVVSIDAFDRAYREQVGRICTKLAAYSERVVRIVCGIGTVIKDA